jgi:beta-lactamase regulating signal transducer with metallopeptidase domain
LQEVFALPHPTLRLSAAATGWLIGSYFAILLFGLYRIFTSWRRARQLVKDADPTALPPQWNGMFENSGRRLSARLPQLRKSAGVRSPVIVGVMHPVLLLPEDFDDHSQNEVEAALFHELAHVRRHDYLGNLLCQLAALPVAWHPLTYVVQQRIRRTREMVCDAIAAQAMQSEVGYAKCLLAMAGRTLGQRDIADATQAIGLLGENVLEERVMRLMQRKTTMTKSARLARVASGATAMILAIAMAASFHVTPTLAQTTGTSVTAPAPSPAPAPPAAPVPPPAPPAPDASIAPVAPIAPPAPDASIAPVAPIAPPAPDASIAPVAPVTPLPPDGSLAPVAPVAPIPPVAPEPAEVKPSTRKNKAVHAHPKKTNDESLVIDSNEDHAFTAEQQAQLKQQMAVMNAQIAEATRHLNSPEFKQQMEEMMKQQSQMRALNLAEMQHQIDAATAKINSPEFKQEIENMQRQMESREWQHSMEEARKQMKVAEQQGRIAMNAVDMAKMQQQIDAATAKINSPEFKQQIENLQKQVESGAMQRSMEEASKQLKAAEDQMRKQQTK